MGQHENVDERSKRIGAYAVLYLVWGSTYLAMRMAVESLPPFSLAAARFFVAGCVLLGWAFARGAARPRLRDWLQAAAVAALLMIGGNASVLWAVQRVPSGVAALVVATTPLWLAILVAFETRKAPAARTVVGILLGLGGVGVLVGPRASTGGADLDPWGVLILVGASISWSFGSLLQRRETGVSPLTATGLQMVAGGGMLAVLALGSGELADFSTLTSATARSWTALAYLTVFGSLLGFTAYGWLMRHDEPARVATYAYVNPVVAVILGALIGGEPVTARVLVAAAVIIAGVVVIVSGRR